MLPELNGIRLVAGADLRLRPGQTVALEVVRQIGGRRWEVSLGGRPATVWSSIDLAPGGAVRARVQRAGDPAAGVPALLRLVASPHASLLEKLQASGLPVDALSQRIVAALLNHGAPLDPHWIGRLRRAAVGREPAEQRRLRALVLLLDRGLDLQEEGTRRLLPLLEGGGWDRQPGSGHQDPGGGRDRPEARGLPTGAAAGDGPGEELAARLKEAAPPGGRGGREPAAGLQSPARRARAVAGRPFPAPRARSRGRRLPAAPAGSPPGDGQPADRGGRDGRRGAVGLRAGRQAGPALAPAGRPRGGGQGAPRPAEEIAKPRPGS